MTDTIGERILAEAAAVRERRILLSVPGTQTDLTCATLNIDLVQRCKAAAEKLYPRKTLKANWHFLASLVGNSTLEIESRGDLWTDEDGDPVTFRSPARFGATEMVEAVRKAVGDGGVITLGSALLEESGFDAEGNPVVEEADPT